MVYFRILNIVPCATQWDLLSTHSVRKSLHLLIPDCQPTLCPPGSHSLLHVCTSVAALVDKFTCIIF